MWLLWQNLACCFVPLYFPYPNFYHPVPYTWIFVTLFRFWLLILYQIVCLRRLIISPDSHCNITVIIWTYWLLLIESHFLKFLSRNSIYLKVCVVWKERKKKKCPTKFIVVRSFILLQNFEKVALNMWNLCMINKSQICWFSNFEKKYRNVDISLLPNVHTFRQSHELIKILYSKKKCWYNILSSHFH